MTLTHPNSPPTASSGLARPALAGLVDGLRTVVHQRTDREQTARLVAQVLRGQLPEPTMLTARERAGDPSTYQLHLLHTELDGAFSIVAAVWRPGQITPIHDHVTWCVVGVLQGLEQEELFTCPTGEYLERAGINTNAAGTVTAYAPPGDIHRVRNPTDATSISLHIYGTDISRVGSSVRREYHLPIQPAELPRPTPAGGHSS